MTFSSQIHEIDIEGIDRSGRQRQNLDTVGLKDSIAKRGLMNPIIVEEIGPNSYKLVAGERRLQSFVELGRTVIMARFASELDPRERQILELEENLHRSPLDWQDTARAVKRIHDLLVELDEDWTATETAAHLGLTGGNVSLQLRLAIELEGQNKRVEESHTAREAYNTLARRDQRAAAAALEDLISAAPPPPGASVQPSPQPDPAGSEDKDIVSSLSPSPDRPDAGAGVVVPAGPPPSVLHGDFIEWAELYRGPKFNLIHCDFPYGVDLFSGHYGNRGADTAYGDERDDFFNLVESFCKNLDNFASASCHIMFWFSMKHFEPLKAVFRNLAPSFEIIHHPLIWGKTDNSGLIGDARRDFRHTYETALFMRRGERVLLKGKADFYGAPTDRALHPSAKPVPVLKHFFEGLVDEHTTLLDPTCGAGSALRAADSLGAARVFGIELDATHAETARVTLSNDRRLRFASKIVG